jgi:hypothetical protein
MKNAPDFVKDNIDSWLDELIAKSKQSRQIHLAISERTPHFEIDYSLSKKALSGLMKGNAARVISASEYEEMEEDDRPDNCLVDASGKTMVNASKLNRIAQEALFDAGIETLYVALGYLKWRRADEKELVSPLAFIPIRLKASGKQVELSTREDEGIFTNIALQMFLKSEHNVELPPFGEPNEAGEPHLITSLTAFEEWLKKVRKLAEEFNWEVPSLGSNSDSPMISVLEFTFTLEAIYRDIKEHESELANSELVQSLVAPIGRSINLNGNEVFTDAQMVDVTQPAEEAFDIFMSDSSQRVCIDAARKGMSFVIQGPPGTGKTQTITNIVANLLYDGKSVLFVADKATALDAVHDKLKQRNLDSFVLRFQDSKMTAKSFANQLYGILESSQKIRDSVKINKASTQSKRIKLRDQLNSHSIESAKIHPGFELPVPEIIGLATRSEVLPVPDVTDFHNLQSRSEERSFVLDFLDYASTLSTKWEPVEHKESSHWFSLLKAMSIGEVESVHMIMTKADQELQALFLDTDLSIHQIQALVDFKNSCDGNLYPRTLQGFTLDDLAKYREVIASLDAAYHRKNVILDLHPSVDVATVDMLLENDGFKALEKALVSSLDLSMKLSEINDNLNKLQQVVSYLETLVTHSETAAVAVGLKEVQSWADVRTISDMHISGSRKVRPSTTWFHPRRLSVADLQRVIDRIEPLVGVAATNEQHLLEAFPSVLEIPDLASYRDVLVKGNSFFGKFSSLYKSTFKSISESSYIDLNQSTLMEMILAFDERRLTLGKMKALTSQLPELLEYDLSSVSEYEELLQALKDSRTALADVHNRQNALLNANPDSSLFYGNSPSSGDDGTDKFVAAVERLFELQTTNVHLKSLLGKTTIQESVIKVSEELHYLKVIRDNLALVAQFGQVDSIQDVSRIVDDLSELGRLSEKIGSIIVQSIELKLADLSESEVKSLDRLMALSTEITQRMGNHRVEAISSFLTVGDSTFKAISAGGIAAANFANKFDALTEQSSLKEITEFAGQMTLDKANYNTWRDHLELADNAHNYEAQEILALAKSRQVSSELLVPFFKAVLAKIVLDTELLEGENFSAEFASGLDAKVSEFRKLDEEAYVNAANAVFAKVSARAIGTSATIQAMINERAKNSRLRIPIREQLSKLGNEVFDVAPVVMANPLNVSKYIPDSLKFDYVIFDEASQLYPAYALASLYRAHKAIVAGDEKQMPPPKTIGGISLDLEDDAVSEDEVRSSDYESLLDFAGRSSSFPEAKLLWHYRSRNESLIAFSNHEFYKGDLFTFPSRFETGQSIAVKFEYVKDGVWYKSSGDSAFRQKGPAGTNPIEAERVASDVQAHAHHFSDENHQAFRKSLMVIATGKKQAELIEELINTRAASDEVLLQFLANQDPKSRFTVKNLETAQGDERDYVFISFAYNQRSDSNREKVSPFFGPLIDQKGWRRLNVAITRARYQMVLYASCKASNIEISRNESVNHIRNFFNYAEVGYAALNLTKVGASSGFTESPFEEEVVRYITSLGYECTSQVGSAGYRLDIGVKHKDYPDVYMLGLECDGYMYHSSAVARDRDRIRQEILEGLGWTIHRIWGTRWYRYNENEKLKLKEVLEAQSQFKPRGILVAKD